ncbi:hypothetical protein ABZT34_40850 [Streptomyces sp. NPDC005329]|uniref:hypothetical protein n=1 Tax=Streptomyces sp. NPDC005329 TaxID=3157034 RepID=UPI0033A705CF
MGIQERHRKVHRPLRRAGLEVLPNAVPAGTMPYVGGYRIQDVSTGFSHRYNTPRLVERLNADWYSLAVSSALLDHRREFLLQLPQGARSHRAALHHTHHGNPAPTLWTRVRLLDHWDIMGRGAASAFLGVHSGHPGFAMMALDSSVYIHASTGETGIDVLAVPHPHRSHNILHHLHQITHHNNPHTNQYTQPITAWLASRPQHAPHHQPHHPEPPHTKTT